MTSCEALRVENVAKRFGALTALRDVSLHLERGEVLGEGPRVCAPMITLLLVCAGRAVGPGELSGAGAAALIERIA